MALSFVARTVSTSGRRRPGTVVSAAMTERTAGPVRGVTDHASEGPDRPAIIVGESRRTYGQAGER